MKFLTVLFCFLIGILLGQTYAEGDIEKAPKAEANSEPPYVTHVPPIKSTTTPPPPTKVNCGSNSLGDYKGGCDESVPVIVMPKGRPIMERVLEWFKCGTPACLKKK